MPKLLPVELEKAEIKFNPIAMKKTSTLIIATLFSTIVFAQSKNPITTKEMQDKIKQAQEQLNKLTPEQKKMMEQMGMSTKVPSIPTGITDADVKAAVNSGGAFGVPSRNTVLIAAIPKITLTATTVPVYIKSLNDYIEKGISADSKTIGQSFYNYYKKNNSPINAIENVAIGFWSTGQPEIAIYIMSKTCSDNADDTDLLSNFAAMLSMGGAPHRAIPILDYLSKQFPGNTTILNNLGQAWFYLGETDKANVQLEKVAKAFAYHPQANYTQCLIQQSKGNTAKAIEKMKNSLAYSFSTNKVNMLKKLGYSVKASDMRKPFRPDPNPLGLKNFIRPDVPTSYTEELKLKIEWDTFLKQVHDKSMQLGKELIPYQQANAQQAQKMYEQYNTKKGKDGAKAIKAYHSRTDNIYRKIAEKNLDEMKKDGGMMFRLKKVKEKIDLLRKDFQAKNDIQKKSIEQQNSIIADKETELAKKGENIGFDNCVVQQKYSEWVYVTYNKPLEEAYQQYLHETYLKITEELYWKQFTQDDPTFEATKIASKKEWMEALGNTRYLATNIYGKCPQVENKSSNYKLANFDELHCKYKTTLDFGVYKQIFECGKARIEFDAGRFSGDLNFMSDNKGNNRFVDGRVETNVINKSYAAGKGPLQVEASVKAGMGIEFSSAGIEDVYVNGEAKVTAGSDTVSDPAGIVNDPSITIAGASGRMSLISGSMTGAITGFGK
ncbi:hypothetical protein ABIE26_003649 [Pedobacter africanus]|uniref:Uncharacterized protein n=1 Tax=Pedobacter africanus TaxID=151894 RepID=A0ACC6L0U3_9SPHI|nr:hypothetical protein [Pedobacter africanus]MDR6784951.1 hypothetical protein [Pedobacter africanus]